MGRNERSVELLEALDALMADESNWGKYRAEYTDVRGHRHFCLVGAGHEVRKRAGVPRGAFMRAMWRIRRAAGFPTIRGFNDRRCTSIRDVRRVLKEALAAENGWRLPAGVVPAETDLTAEERVPARVGSGPAVWTSGTTGVGDEGSVATAPAAWAAAPRRRLGFMR